MQYAATQQDAKLRTPLLMNPDTPMSDFLSPETAEALTNGNRPNGMPASRPPTPPDSGTATPRLTIQLCPDRLWPYYPAPNYGAVDEHKIYRSSYPQDRHIAFVRGLGIRSVLTLVDTEPCLGFQYWVEGDALRWAKLHVSANKDKEGRIDTKLDSICEALLFLMNGSNYPIYAHCNQGKHRTGCVIGCLRRVQGWSIDEAINEYDVYAGGKSRPGDKALIKSFDPNAVFEYAKSSGMVDELCEFARQDRTLRQYSEIVDIDAFRAALEAGLLGDMELERTNSSGSNSNAGTLSPPPMTVDSSGSSEGTLSPPPTTVRVHLPGERVNVDVEMKPTENVEDTPIVDEGMSVSEPGSGLADVNGEQEAAPLEDCDVDPELLVEQ